MKFKYLFYLATIIVIGIVACKSGDKKEPAPQETATAEDSLAEEVVDSGFSTETIDTFSTTAFSSYAKKRVASFDWSRFRVESIWTEDRMLTNNYTPTKQFYDAYGRFIKYSPDSTLFVDLDSYNVELVKDKQGRITGTEVGPDVEVSLVNLKSKTKTRLLFLGPGNSIEDAYWLDKDNLALMGIEQDDSLGKIAAVWKFHLPTSTFTLYELKDSVAARQLMGYWRKERLKGVVMN